MEILLSYLNRLLLVIVITAPYQLGGTRPADPEAPRELPALEARSKAFRAQDFAIHGSYNPLDNTGNNETGQIQNLIDRLHVSGGGTIIFENTNYLIDGLVWKSRVHASFDNTRFYSHEKRVDMIDLSECHDVAFHGKLALRIERSGDDIQSRGIAGTNVSRLYIEEVSGSEMQTLLYFRGLLDSRIDKITGFNIRGWKFDDITDPSGSLLVLQRSKRSTFGNIVGHNINKAAVYFSVNNKEPTYMHDDNEDISISNIDVELTDRPGSNASGLAIRSGVRIAIGSIKAKYGHRGILIGNAKKDNDYRVSDISINRVTAQSILSKDTSESVYLKSEREDRRIKRIKIGQIFIKNTASHSMRIAVDQAEFGKISIHGSGILNPGAESLKIINTTETVIHEIILNDSPIRPIEIGTSESVHIGSLEVRDPQIESLSQQVISIDPLSENCLIGSVQFASSKSSHDRELQESH